MSLYATLLKAARQKAVWAKARPMAGYDPNVWRQDAYGSVIRYADCGDRSSAYGWEIDHVSPTMLPGRDTYAHLRPLHWRNSAVRQPRRLAG